MCLVTFTVFLFLETFPAAQSVQSRPTLHSNFVKVAVVLARVGNLSKFLPACYPSGLCIQANSGFKCPKRLIQVGARSNCNLLDATGQTCMSAERAAIVLELLVAVGLAVETANVRCSGFAS